MKTGFLLLTTWFLSIAAVSQQRCAAVAYHQYRLQLDPSLNNKIQSILQASLAVNPGALNRMDDAVIRIPVVVHILYHNASDKLTDAQVYSQIVALNTCYRHRNADSIKTPVYFKSKAADCGIEFQLASSDPHRKFTNGIVRKYTPVTKWDADDQVKFSSSMGDDAWDTRSYLNIWVCNLDRLAGYSSVMGDDINKDGIVINTRAFGVTSNADGYDLGKTAVHESGHWLNLRHLWGDTYCGDDDVDDTPRQSGYTVGCPTEFRSTCGNGSNGDMYMNYMDFTNDACMNLFTMGQKERMRALFAPGGYRYSILTSKGLSAPLIFESPLPEQDPKWLHPNLYPNPSTGVITLDLAYDIRWVGAVFQVSNITGQTVMQVAIKSKIQQIEISHLKPGIYFLAAKKGDGESYKQKFVKL